MYSGEVAGHHTHFSLYRCDSDLIKENLPGVVLRLKQVTLDTVVITSGKLSSKEADANRIAFSDCVFSFIPLYLQLFITHFLH